MEVFSAESLFSGGDFGDRRLSKRFSKSMDAISRRPAATFPQILENEADLEGWYRFLANPRVTVEAILAPHIESTIARVSERSECLAIHDTSTFSFEGDGTREGLTQLSRDKQGFCGHFAIAASVGEVSEPLGLLGLETYTHRDRGKGTKQSGIRPDKAMSERGRWIRLIEACESAVGEKSSLIHVMDREADGFEELSFLVENSYRFVVRGHFNRVLKSGEKLLDVLYQAPALAERTIDVSPRKITLLPGHKKVRIKQSKRKARLEFSSAEVVLPPPQISGKTATISVNVVLVKEKNCPKTAVPIEWILYTTEDVSTAENIARIVDIYRKRWLIEEYFKALKTGCGIEKRQLESKATLLKALAVFIPVAWKILRMRSLAHLLPSQHSGLALTPIQIKILRHSSKTPVPSRLTNRSLLLAVARLGGHLKHNGPPGWITIARGYEQILWSEVGWRMAMEAASQGYDQ
jgi:hypothetical protein